MISISFSLNLSLVIDSAIDLLDDAGVQWSSFDAGRMIGRLQYASTAALSHCHHQGRDGTITPMDAANLPRPSALHAVFRAPRTPPWASALSRCINRLE